MDIFRKLMRAAFPDKTWEVDLHGMRVEEALATVAEAIAATGEAGGATIRIICGKGKHSKGGKGVLREAVAGWLEAHGHGDYKRKVEGDGLDGSIIVQVNAKGPPKDPDDS